jgi:hypothetical protein
MSLVAPPERRSLMDTPCALKLPGGLASRSDARGASLFALRPFQAGEPVMRLEHVTWRPIADDATVDHPSGRHLYDPVLAMVADRSDGNCRLSLELMALIARRDIAAGETISNDFHRGIATAVAG